MEPITPIYILSGFLGSGKTTLLTRLIAHWKERGLKPAVIMNEIGEVNIDGLAADSDVPTSEMLSGCICCTIRSNLPSELAMLIKREQPDVIVIEATGIANPMEILDATAEASLYMRIDVRQMITVIDSAHLLTLHAEQKGKTYRLMQEQIRAATLLVLNKTDRINEQEQGVVKSVVQRWNPHAPILSTVKCELDIQAALATDGDFGDIRLSSIERSHPAHDHDSHEHVMSYTYYFSHPVNSVAFERFVANLPRDVYRAKGILSFSDTNSRFLFQYAFRESDYMKITPPESVPDVAVFIGEHFHKSELKQQLQSLERNGCNAEEA